MIRRVFKLLKQTTLSKQEVIMFFFLKKKVLHNIPVKNREV